MKDMLARITSKISERIRISWWRLFHARGNHFPKPFQWKTEFVVKFKYRRHSILVFEENAYEGYFYYKHHLHGCDRWDGMEGITHREITDCVDRDLDYYRTYEIPDFQRADGTWYNYCAVLFKDRTRKHGLWFIAHGEKYLCSVSDYKDVVRSVWEERKAKLDSGAVKPEYFSEIMRSSEKRR